MVNPGVWSCRPHEFSCYRASLSTQYALAKTPEARHLALAAGQAMIALFEENAFLVSYVIVSFSWLIPQ